MDPQFESKPLDYKGISLQIERICHELNPRVATPDSNNPMLALFVKFVLDKNIVGELDKKNPLIQEGEKFSDFIDRRCRAVASEGEKVYVPGRDNNFISEFVNFCNDNNLWDQFRPLFQA
jgi:hypothetical protein